MPVQAKKDPHDHHGRRASGPKGKVTSARMQAGGQPVGSASSAKGAAASDGGKKCSSKKSADMPSQDVVQQQQRAAETKPEQGPPQREERKAESPIPEVQEARDVKRGQRSNDENKDDFVRNGARPKPPESPRHSQSKTNEPPPPSSQPKVFAIETFNKNMDNFAEMFSADRFSHVTEDYPAEDLISVVSSVTESIEEFKQQTLSSQRHLADLKERMRHVKDRIQTSVMKKSNEVRQDDEKQTIEERELTEKLAKFNAQVAQANSELADALRLSAETELTATEAQLAAEKAKEEAKQIQEELEFKKRVEERRRLEDARKMEEAKRLKEEERRREEEQKRKKEAEWRRKEAGGEKAPHWEKWPSYEYKIEANQLGCIIRGHPNKFGQHQVSCKMLDQLDCPVTFEQHEELVSPIISLTGHSDKPDLEEPIVVCIPYIAPRHGAGVHVSREAVVKANMNGKWQELETKEEVIESHKEFRFAVAELKCLTKVAAFSRLKRDYATITKKGGKVTSSFDQRITVTVPKDGLPGNDHLLMEVQPVDSATVGDLRNRSGTCKGLLTSSPIIRMEWESDTFNKPITVTVPCPPNPAKAKKIAAMRKAKEEKMKNPHKVVVMLPHEQEALEKEKKSKLQRLQDELAQKEKEETEAKPTRWYLGEYANNEDDETDQLVLVSGSGHGKWAQVPDVQVMQVKLDLLQFDLDKPLEKFMVLRTRTNVDEHNIGPIACEVSQFLTQRFAQVILRQKSDDPFNTVLSVVPASKTEKTMKKLSDEGYDEGPDISQPVNINEGDIIEVCFRGNVTKKDDQSLDFVYNSNIESETDFYAKEVDKYLQRNYPVYRGVVEVYKKFEVKSTKKLRVRETDEHDPPPVETKRELLCEMAMNIPKYHVEPNSTLVKAPITIRNSLDPVNENLMRLVADELGDEWRSVAMYLNVSKARIQAILRQYCDQSDPDAKFDMLMTWLKRTTKAVDKVACLTSALTRSGRGDIAEDLEKRYRDFRQQERAN